MPKTTTLDERKKKIFAALVRDYLESAEPVGSRTIWKTHMRDLSPATIRNEMADLEDAGLIHQPHTSAGRIPTDKGYRYFVDNLLESKPLSQKEAELIKRHIKELHNNIEEILHDSVKLISSLCNYTSIALFPSNYKSAFRVLSSGVSKLLEQPEFNHSNQVQPLLEMLDHEEFMSKVLSKYLQNKEVTIKIGHENKPAEMQNISIIIKSCEFRGHQIGGFGVIGPTRMTYGKVTQIIDSVSKEIEQLSLF